MIVLFTEADGSVTPYDAGELTCGEADAVSRATDLEWVQVDQALRQQSPNALRAVVWAWRKRAEPTLRFSAFDPPLKALKARFSTEEIPEFLKAIDRSPFSPEEREQALREIVDLAVDPEAARTVIDAETGPKDPVSSAAPSLSGSGSTSLSSPTY